MLQSENSTLTERPMRTVFEIAEADGRGYITPEDVIDSRASGCPGELLRKHVLQAMAGKATGRGLARWGVEGKSTACHFALEECDR